MSATTGAKGPPTSGRLDALAGRLEGTALYERLANAGGMGGLAVRSLALAARPPYPWLRDAVVEFSLIIRRCILPLAAVVFTFVIGFGFFVLGGITEIIGANDREGGAFILGFVREAGVWLTVMTVAGVAGSAITADLGSRKIREELDALSVLGVDQVRALVVPRVVALTIGTPIMGLLAILMIEASNFVLSPAEFGYSREVLLAATKGSLISLDIIGALIRYVVIGIFVGAVACYKGLNCEGGTEGVGRAVNQAVVITFFGIWMFNATFNLLYLTVFPESQVAFKG